MARYQIDLSKGADAFTECPCCGEALRESGCEDGIYFWEFECEMEIVISTEDTDELPEINNDCQDVCRMMFEENCVYHNRLPTHTDKGNG